ncbi:MAG: hypothetical protein ABIS23_03695 [Sphingomicrobium sp.]
MKAAALLLATTLALTACATARMHDQQALNSVALDCGMTYGELIQDAEEKKLLIALKSNISLNQRICITQWARRNHMKTVFVHLDVPAT